VGYEVGGRVGSCGVVVGASVGVEVDIGVGSKGGKVG
jgi:hypothetical protein